MNKRLQTILEIEHITASQLADTLGIQRGGVSHLLSGRNKPSFDFLERILRKFPEISAEWLITGQGKPIRSENGQTTPISLFNDLDNESKRADIQSNVFDSDLFGTPIIQNAPTNSKPPIPETDRIKVQQTTTLPDSNNKKPIRIIVYFSDGTYSEFYPFSVTSPSVK